MTPPTTAEIDAAYKNNADYAAVNSVSKCNLFITACVRIIGTPEQMSERGQGTSAEHEYNMEMIREELQYARQWLVANSNTGSKASSGQRGGNLSISGVDFRSGAGRR